MDILSFQIEQGQSNKFFISNLESIPIQFYSIFDLIFQKDSKLEIKNLLLWPCSIWNDKMSIVAKMVELFFDTSFSF